MKLYVARFWWTFDLEESGSILGIFDSQEAANTACENAKAMDENIDTSSEEYELNEACYP